MAETEPAAGGGENPAARLKQVLRPSGYFALSFGTIVGSGWVILLGEWLGLAGPGGAIVAFLAGGALMLLVGACYGELASRIPIVGGEFAYASQVLGPRTGFVVGWFLTLFMLSFCAFEGIALGWLIETLIPAIKGPVLYTIGDEPVTLSAAVIGIVGMGAIALINLRSVAVGVAVQKMITYGFIVASLAFILVGLAMGDDANLAPLFPERVNGSWMMGALWIFATCSVFLTGFQSALQAVEERAPDVSIRAMVISMLAGIAAAAAFYALLVLAAARSVPWPSLITADLPAAAAFGGLPGAAALRDVVLAVAAVSLIKTWNALMIMASRLVFAQARGGFLPRKLGLLSRSGAPAAAVIVLAGIASIGILLGRSAVIPIVTTATICVSMSFVVSLLVLVRLRRTETRQPTFAVPGGMPAIVIALVGMSGMAIVALVEPILRKGTIPVEWLILIAWGLFGAVLLRRAHGAAAARTGSQVA